jgi:hypothetical protein
MKNDKGWINEKQEMNEWENKEGFSTILSQLIILLYCIEDEFFDVIGIKVLIVFLIAIHSHIY